MYRMFDIRRIQVHTLKEFFKEFAMIVLGILTAITIEHQYTQSHKRHLAEKAAQQVRQEIAANLQLVEDSIKSNEKNIQQFNELEQKLVQDIQAKLPREQALSTLEKNMDGRYGIGAYVIEPAQDAWDAAIASQAVVQMKPKDLQAFSRLYAKQKAVNNELVSFQQGMRTGLWMRWNNVITDLQFQRLDTLEFLKVLREFIGNLTVLNNKMKMYREALQAVKPLAEENSDEH